MKNSLKIVKSSSPQSFAKCHIKSINHKKQFQKSHKICAQKKAYNCLHQISYKTLIFFYGKHLKTDHTLKRVKNSIFSNGV